MQITKAVFFVSEAACLLGCSSYQIYRMIHEGKLLAYKDEGANNLPSAVYSETV